METAAPSRGKKIAAILGRIYLAVMLIGLPLAVHDGFFDITETKTLWFVVFSVVFLTARLVCAIQFSVPGHVPALPKRPGEIAALLFCFIALLASVGSGNLRESFLGGTGRWQGCAMVWIYAALYFAFSGLKLRDRDIFRPLGLGLLLTGALAVANHLGWDPLGFAERLIDFDRGRYISTLGNINFAGAYISLGLPVLAGAMLYAARPAARMAYGIICFVGFWAALAVRSECVILGLGAAGLAMPLLVRRDRDLFRRSWLLWPAAVALGQLYRVPAALCGAKLSSLTALLLRPVLSVPIAAAGVVMYLLARKKDPAWLDRAYGLLLLAVALLGAAGLILLNTVFSGTDLGRWGEWLRFSDEWGTDRIRVWKYCLGIYRDFPLWEKLVGGGCGILASIDFHSRLFNDAILDAAHCEYIQILLNWGALGLAAYLLWIIAQLRDGLRRGGTLSLILAAGLVGYGVQAAVNIAQAPGIMLFFVLLAVHRADPCRKSP